MKKNKKKKTLLKETTRYIFNAPRTELNTEFCSSLYLAALTYITIYLFILFLLYMS